MFYRCFGPVEAVRDGVPIELGGPKQRAVLAVLLLDAGRVVSSDRLVQSVWGDEQPPSVMGSLQVHISNLRRLLRDDERATSPIVRQPPGYLLHVEQGQLDIDVFRARCDEAQAAVKASNWAAAVVAARAAIALWRGPLLLEYADQDWVQLAATGLEQRLTSCRQDLIAGLLGTTQVAEALAAASALHAEDPLSERVCWLHMIALYRAGRTADALETYRQQAKRMDDQLGLGVGAALRDLQGAMLRQQPHLDVWPATLAETSTPGVVEPDAPAAERDRQSASPAGPQIVGRIRELRTIEEVLAESRTAGSRWIVLTGAAGIGKSRLAEEAVIRWQQAGGAVLRTRCPEDDVPAWWPIRQLLRDLGAGPEEMLVPSPGADADAGRFEVYDRLLALLDDAVRTSPLLLLVDDVHWADSTSARFLTYLCEALQAPGIAVLLTVRESEGGPAIARLLATVARQAGSRQLSLPPLSSDEVRLLADQVSGQSFAADQAADLALRTGGNPFFVCEYARLPEGDRRSGEMPVAVRSVLGLRLAGLDPGVLQVLRTAALIGDSLDVELLAAVSRLDRDELAEMLDEAADERIIVAAQGTGSYMFAHALLREEVVAGLTPMRRQRLHLRIAEAIGPGGSSDRLVRRAAHLLAALPLSDARETFEACRAAAEDAELSWQSDAAAHWWENAVVAYDHLADSDDEERDELVIARVAALARAGRGQTVLDAVDAALLDAVRRGRFGSAGRLAATLLRASGSWPWVAHGSDPGPLLARLAGIEPLVRLDPSAHARVLAALAVGSYYDTDATVTDRLSAHALELAETLADPDVLADALLGRALAFSAVATRAEESIELLNRLAGLPHRLSPIDDVVRHSLMSMALLTTGDPDAAAEHIREGAVGSDVLRLPVSRVQLRWMEGTLALWRGNYVQAQQLFDHAAEIHRQTELYVSGTHDIAMLALAWQEDRLASPRLSGHPTPSFVPWAEAVLAAAAGDERADELIATELARMEPVMWTTHGRYTMLAHAVADLGLDHHAASLRSALEPYARFIANIGQVGVVGPVAYALARICHLMGDAAAARAHLSDAIELSRRAKSPTAEQRCLAFAAQL